MKQNTYFKLNKKKWEHLVGLRGWRHPISMLAKRTGFTKSYCSQAINGGIPISHDFMLAIVNVAGASHKETEEWANLFEIVKNAIGGRPVGSYQRDNYAKYQGKKAYNEDSIIGQIRKEDRAKDMERLNQPEPIPAKDYYQDHELVPKKCYVSNRYKR